MLQSTCQGILPNERGSNLKVSLHLTVEHHTNASSPDESGCDEAGSFTKHNGYEIVDCSPF